MCLQHSIHQEWTRRTLIVRSCDSVYLRPHRWGSCCVSLWLSCPQRFPLPQCSAELLNYKIRSIKPFICEALLTSIRMIFTQDIEVKVLPFLSSNVRNNTGVPAAIFHCGMHKAQAAATCGLKRQIISIYLWSSWNVFTGNVSINIFLLFHEKKTYQGWVSNTSIH